MVQAIVTSKIIVVPRRAMRKFTSSVLHYDLEKNKRAKDDAHISKANIGNSMLFPTKPKAPESIPYHNEIKPDTLYIPDNNDYVDDNGIPLYEKLITDYWIKNEVYVP